MSMISIARGKSPAATLFDAWREAQARRAAERAVERLSPSQKRDMGLQDAIDEGARIEVDARVMATLMSLR